MSKYYSIEMEYDGRLELAVDKVMKGLCGKLQNEHGSRGSVEFWRCQRQLAIAVLAHIEMQAASTDPLNTEGLRTRHLVAGTQHPLVGRPSDLSESKGQ